MQNIEGSANRKDLKVYGWNKHKINIQQSILTL